MFRSLFVALGGFARGFGHVVCLWNVLVSLELICGCAGMYYRSRAQSSVRVLGVFGVSSFRRR